MFEQNYYLKTFASMPIYSCEKDKYKYLSFTVMSLVSCYEFLVIIKQENKEQHF